MGWYSDDAFCAYFNCAFKLTLILVKNLFSLYKYPSLFNCYLVYILTVSSVPKSQNKWRFRQISFWYVKTGKKKWWGLYTMVIRNMEQTRSSRLIEVGSCSIWSIVFSNIYKSTKFNIASDQNRQIGYWIFLKYWPILVRKILHCNSIEL